jgi:hypothetical protein
MAGRLQTAVDITDRLQTAVDIADRLQTAVDITHRQLLMWQRDCRLQLI